VQTHLVHIFAKLDIASRAQLAAEVTGHPPATTTSTGASAEDRSLTR
jgi:hypothetical protein